MLLGHIIGSALAVSPPLFPLFEQLGIYNDLCAIGKPARVSMFIKENFETILELDYVSSQEL
jgi:hypothetical protein